MRKHKYRAWDKEIEDFVYSDKQYDDAWFAFNQDSDGRLKAYALHGMEGDGIDEPQTPCMVELEEPQQYITKYKNGASMYEGDLIKEGDITAMIEWDERFVRFGYRTDTGSVGLYGFCGEKVGNIYENKDLLKNSD